MARTSQKAIDKTAKSMSTTDSPTIQIVKPVSLSTIDAFIDCLSIQPNSSFYEKIPDIYFIRPTKQMNTLLETAGEYAVSDGSELVYQYLKNKKDSGSDNDSGSETESEVDSNNSYVPHHCEDHIISSKIGPKQSRDYPNLEELK